MNVTIKVLVICWDVNTNTHTHTHTHTPLLYYGDSLPESFLL